ncbi:MAG: polyprenyl synthetase family protein [Saprospiraceae bacterium]|jgi:octaprenyl-diphosphate synthase|nr:polyprenyl synthetase family protein [Saprospiraceae bacterium]MDC1289649.1 polyprenyl synthetase family protein [bacterium]|tara:strand:- start:11157 stop:12131 length:975 start_codon:yes stop_codon:yes gene_type:complete
MKPSLKQIQSPIQTDLKEFESHFRDSMKSNVALLDKIMYYIVQRKGKQMRPMLVFLTAQLHGDINKNTHLAASMIELLHTATLVHDDIVDDADKRRGFFSVSALWKNKIAVLVGDYLLSKGLLLALENNQFYQLKLLSRSVKMVIEGELLQQEKARRLDIKEEVYYDIINRKTASLLAASCAVGASTTTEDSKLIERMELFGEKIGMAFQIKDDLFDFGDKDIGKPVGIDIKEKKMTLPLIYALQNANISDRKKYIRYVSKSEKNKKYVTEVVAFVKASGGLEYATQKMLEFQQEAFDILDEFPNSETKASLKMLIEYVTKRSK